MDGITTSINTILKNLIKNFNTLLDCPVRFSGEYEGEKVHNFIEYIEYYKRIKCIGDEQALQELQYLLLDQAHSWWLRRKTNLHTWSEALTVLENHYAKRRPTHEVYMEILKHNYADYESKEDFIDDKVELFNELSQPELREDNKLEIIYALLPNDVQNKVKFVNISSIKELKEQLKLLKLDSVPTLSNLGNMISNTKSADAPNGDLVQTPSNQDNIISTSKSTEPPNGVLTEEQNEDCSKKDSVQNESNNQTLAFSTDSNADSERDPIIKVRRTEDLMPQDIKEEEETHMQQEEFIANHTESTTNHTSQANHEDFQIDTDIMNQINNIIDESEMNISALNNNQVNPSIITQPKNDAVSLELLGFNIETNKQPEINSKNYPEHQSKSSLNVTKKVKLRCSYCRKGNHTAQTCFKRAKHMQQSPERFLTTKPKEGNDILPTKNNEEHTEYISSNNNNNNSNTTNPNISATEPAVTTPPTFLNQVPTTSILYTSLITTSPIVTSSSSVIPNTNTESKLINTTLTTKLIAPINGKTSNKMLAAKLLRSINTPSPKCHQCGTVGYYKSICPNCSPIYNNNNNHNPYGK
ncbi:probable serine/threonine-protein kinase DDB_G0282963 [Calliphora vicina]|uniref:probable serine/threonine-protein kinase DDB_G0282963 n=1 Tax=Calliphora vicina TaxID=7373 RepID=UPI00325A6B57